VFVCGEVREEEHSRLAVNIYLCMQLSISISPPSICTSLSLSPPLSIYLSLYVSIYMSIYLSISIYNIDIDAPALVHMLVCREVREEEPPVVRVHHHRERRKELRFTKKINKQERSGTKQDRLRVNPTFALL